MIGDQEKVFYMELVAMTETGVLGTRGVTPLDARFLDESLAGYLPYYKTFVACDGRFFWRPSCLYIPNVSKHRFFDLCYILNSDWNVEST